MLQLAKHSAILILFATLLAGCGGSSGGDAPVPAPAPTPTPPPSGGIEGSGIALGTITGFGSVIVNGVRYDTANAQITVDGQAATQDDLSVGDVVVVVGSVDSDGVNGTADRVRLDHIVEGPISALDAAAGTFVILSQTVRVDASTVFDDDITPASIDGLSIGLRVEVSGFVAGDGGIVATRIEDGDVNDDLELSGIVAGLDSGASTFEINGQAIEYSGATLDDFPNGGIADDQLVEVYASGVDGNGTLVATRVEYYDEFDDFEDGDELEIEGLISRFASATDFDLAGLPVTTNSGTEYEGGTASDLALNVRVEVEGELNGSGVVVADDVKFKAPPSARVGALVEAIDDTSLVVLGLTLLVDDSTSFEDNSDADLSSFSLADIRVGDYVEVRVRAASDAGGALLARRIERDDAEDEATLVGAVDSVMQPSLVVLGVTIETNGDTEYEIEDSSVSAAEFFAQVGPGAVVDVDGVSTSPGVIVADEIELDDDDD